MFYHWNYSPNKKEIGYLRAAERSEVKRLKCSAKRAPVAGKHDVVNEASWESLAKEIEALRKANAALRFNQSVLDLTRMFVWG